MIRLARTLIFPALALLLVSTALAGDPWVVYQGGEGPGQGKNVVLISGDEEYRSEEALPQLAKILAKHHGFTCTVLFAIGKDGTIEPNRNDNIPGLEALRKADLMIIATRFRDLPDDQMKEIVDYVESGRPIIGMRTATHAFNLKGGKKYARYSLEQQGVGRRLRPPGARRDLGQPPRPPRSGKHARNHRAGRDRPPDPARDQGRRHLGPDRRLRSPAAPAGRQQAAGPRPGRRGHDADRQAGRRQEERPDDAGRLGEDLPASPESPPGSSRPRWAPHRPGERGRAPDARQRRLLDVGLDDKISPESDVSLVGEYKPRPFGFNGAAKGVKPEAHAAH